MDKLRVSHHEVMILASGATGTGKVHAEGGQEEAAGLGGRTGHVGLGLPLLGWLSVSGTEVGLQ